MSCCLGQTNVLACIYLKLFFGLSCSSTGDRNNDTTWRDGPLHNSCAMPWMGSHSQEVNESSWLGTEFRLGCMLSVSSEIQPTARAGKYQLFKKFYPRFFSEGFTATAFTAVACSASRMKTRSEPSNTRLQDTFASTAFTPGKPVSNMQQPMKGSKLWGLP